MVQQGNAKAGRSNAGQLDPQAAWLNQAGGSARAPDQAEENEDPRAEFGEGQSDAEAQLYADLNRFSVPKPTGFAPFDTLAARLDELNPVRADDSRPAHPHTQPGDLAWFETKFDDLKRIVERDSGRREIAAINAKLAEIIARVDRLAAAIPGEKTMVAVETQLAHLSQSLALTREQSAADADRISRAAQEIMAATGRAEAARVGFETAARHTVKELGQTVAITASRAASVTAEQIAAALQRTAEREESRPAESGLRELHERSRESNERTARALEKVHETLREFLERGAPARVAAPTSSPVRKRAGVHMPIAAGVPAFARPDSGFGTTPAQKPQLDTITLRTPPPPDPKLLEALQEAEARLDGARKHGSSKDRTAEGAPHVAGPPLFREEDRSLPLVGLGIVAAVLLLASAALFYLHTRPLRVPLHLSFVPGHLNGYAFAKPAGNGFTTSVRSADEADPGAQPSTLLSASGDARAGVRPPGSGEDLEAVTEAAIKGDSEAQFRIASRFLSDGASQNEATTAARWLARAAAQGHAESQFVLASMYERGAGITKDGTQALALYRKAAEGGHVQAMHNLAVILSAHDNADDYHEAARWFERAAMAGLADSQYNLALLYERGLGLREDLARAYFWYEVAARSGDVDARARAETLKRRLSVSDCEAAVQRAAAWRPGGVSAFAKESGRG